LLKDLPSTRESKTSPVSLAGKQESRSAAPTWNPNTVSDDDRIAALEKKVEKQAEEIQRLKREMEDLKKAILAAKPPDAISDRTIKLASSNDAELMASNVSKRIETQKPNEPSESHPIVISSEKTKSKKYPPPPPRPLNSEDSVRVPAAKRIQGSRKTRILNPSPTPAANESIDANDEQEPTKTQTKKKHEGSRRVVFQDELPEPIDPTSTGSELDVGMPDSPRPPTYTGAAPPLPPKSARIQKIQEWYKDE
jgi:hypothetical protein